MGTLTRSEYRDRYGDAGKTLFENTMGALVPAFRQELGWPIVPLPLSFSWISEDRQLFDDIFASMSRKGLNTGPAQLLEKADQVGDVEKCALMAEALWRPLIELIGKIGSDKLVATCELHMADDDTSGKLPEEDYAIEFPNDWLGLDAYYFWEWATILDNLIFDHTRRWGIHSWEHEPRSFFGSSRAVVDAYMATVGGVRVVRAWLDIFLLMEEGRPDADARYNAFIGQPPFVTADVPSGACGQTE